MRFPFFEFVMAVRMAAALIFLTAAAGKMRRWSSFEGVVANYRLLPNPLNRLVAWLLPPFELLLALALLLGVPETEATAGVLLSIFGVAMAINLLRGRTFIDCGCFDASLRQPLRWLLVARNGVLAALLIIAAESRVPAEPRDAVTLTLGVLAGAALFVVVQSANLIMSLPGKRRTT